LDSLTGRAEQSSRAGDVINAAAQLRNRQLNLARLTGGLPRTQGTNYLADLSLTHSPVTAIIPRPPAETANPVDRIRVAMTLRPELPQAQLELDNGELEVVRTRNGLLPRLDFTVRAATNGVGDSYGDASDMAGDFHFGSWRAGLELEVPLGNRSARASDRRAQFNRDLAKAAVANQRQAIEFDVRQSLIEVQRAQRLIKTTEVARRQREQSLFNERQRLSVGSGTRLEVVQAERDLIQAQIDQVSAEIGLTKAFVELHRAEGSTLVRTGVTPITVTTLSQQAPSRTGTQSMPAAMDTPPARTRTR
jgi:outer membrane protein TolC